MLVVAIFISYYNNSALNINPFKISFCDFGHHSVLPNTSLRSGSEKFRGICSASNNPQPKHHSILHNIYPWRNDKIPVKVLEKRGLEEEGLYRVVGVASKVIKLLNSGLDRRKLEKLNLGTPQFLLLCVFLLSCLSVSFYHIHRRHCILRIS